MRIVRELSFPSCRVTVLHWNNRYLIKLEHGYFEQTYKVNEVDFSGEDEVIKLVDDLFVKEALVRFEQMSQSLEKASHRIGH